MRCPFEFAKTHFPDGRVDTYVEVGVYRGVNVDSVLAGLIVGKAYLIDAWGMTDFFLCELRTRLDGDTMYEEVKAKYADRPEQIEIIRATSAIASVLVPNNLDLVYIDADHSYEGVQQDLAIWYPKVRAGGILAGDDYHYYPGVVRAVAEFIEARPELELHVGNTKTQWWIVK